MELKLKPFQYDIVKKTAPYKRVAYFYDMGLGKTFIGAEKLKLNNTFANLCICQKSKIKDWVEHFSNYYEDYKIFNLTKKKDIEAFIREPSKKIAVVNYDMAFRLPVLRSLYDFTLLLDESSLLKNIKSRRTDFIVNELEPSYVILLSGTPCGGKYEQLFPQMKLLGWSGNNWQWECKFVNKKKIVTPSNPRGFNMIVGYKNLEEMDRFMRDHNCYFKKACEVIKELPKENDIFIDIDDKVYKNIYKNGIIQTASGEKSILKLDTPMAMMTALRYMASAVSEAKREVIKDLLDGADDRLIFFYWFKKEKELLTEMLNEYGRKISFVDGDVKKIDLSNFMENENGACLIQFQAGAYGLNLQIANKIIYTSLPLSYELYSQSRARISRIGQNKPCMYYHLLNGIENSIYELLKNRADYTSVLFTKDFEHLTKKLKKVSIK